MSDLRNTLVGGAFVLAALATAGCSSPGGASSGSSAGKAPEAVVYEADYPAYDSLDGVIEAADVIVTGEVVDSRVEELLPDEPQGDDPLANPQAGVAEEDRAEIEPVVTTVSTLRVSGVLAGDVRAGDTIEVSQLGGELGGTTYREESTTPLAGDGTEYVLMLADHGDDAPYDLLNPEQALYTVKGKTVRPVTGEGFGAAGTLDSLGRTVDSAK
ncbi:MULTISPECIES: hypothetical protein [Streptomyces]|uniref:Lipoprotein n=2 Tax=Streptomyces TaxID=1883 RepID=A0A3R7FJU8_9ACTN|nr:MULTISPECIES: hypothetical protein [Streptomyces]KNE84100.1 hypothetical protein ADZ36_02155 [Streptomyces fradiae]OFA59581.1 hypothetical protein BEN35_02220 [Streptomyces fradiae]PQM24787.1 hypothetical protein Sfr7A_00860 [Streptomyces xinghaiensis]RKM98841.1 hypothetical protein SFRA_000860 [Streptomyces xinghaiensis]RNC76259.1 hypothetical protein DC095_003515 [Streptomyces xinghaiensis]